MNFERRFHEILRTADGDVLERERDRLVSRRTGVSVPVVRGIPRFVGVRDGRQEQVRGAFAYKWQRTPAWGLSGDTASQMTDWMMSVLGWRDEAHYAAYLSGARVILDAGCGNGRETIRLARLNPEALVIGLDISDAVDVAAENAAGMPNVRFVQGDLCSPPIAQESVDYVLSFGVLHHTPDTRCALLALVPLLRGAGELAFYVYRRKAPLREFSDDYVRGAIRSMSPTDAWAEMERLTLLGKALSDLKVQIDVPAVPTLGIEAGRHDVQRLLYYTVVKCYWRDGWSLEENTHVNFDWFYPQYAWRHTPAEVRAWLAEAHLVEKAFVEIPAGLSFRVARASAS
jgi:SAM-dependent methyltransferase